MTGRLAPQGVAQVCGVYNGPHLGRNTGPAKHLQSIDGRHAETDVADVFVGREILIGQNDSLYQLAPILAAPLSPAALALREALGNAEE